MLLTVLERLPALLPVSVAEAVLRGVEEALKDELAELVAVAQSEARLEGVSCADPAALPVALPQALSLAVLKKVAEITEVAEVVGVADSVSASVCTALALSVCEAWLVAVKKPDSVEVTELLGKGAVPLAEAEAQGEAEVERVGARETAPLALVEGLAVKDIENEEEKEARAVPDAVDVAHIVKSAVGLLLRV